MTMFLDAYLDAVPSVVVERLRGARRVLAVSHENPDADTLGATLAIVRIVEALGGTADAVCTDEPPPLYAFMPGVERFRTDPDPAATYDLLVISDCGALSRVGDVGVRHADLFAEPAARHRRSPRLQRRGRGRRLDRTALRGHVRDGDPAGGPARRPAHDRRWRARREPDGRHRHGYRDLRPPERHAPDARRRRRPGRRRCAAVRHLASALSDQAGGAASAVRPHPRSPREHRRGPDRLVHA